MSNDNQIERLWRLQAKVNMLVSDGKRDAKEVADIYQGILDGAARRSWHEKYGVIHFSVTSDGATGEDWIMRLSSSGYRVGDHAKGLLRSPDFKPTSGVMTEVAVLRSEIFNDKNRTTEKVVAEAGKRMLSKPNAELSCLIREKFTNEEVEAMGLVWIAAMHEPIKDSVGDPCLLEVNRLDGDSSLSSFLSKHDSYWAVDGGFAFVVSQTRSDF